MKEDEEEEEEKDLDCHKQTLSDSQYSHLPHQFKAANGSKLLRPTHSHSTGQNMQQTILICNNSINFSNMCKLA